MLRFSGVPVFHDPEQHTPLGHHPAVARRVGSAKTQGCYPGAPGLSAFNQSLQGACRQQRRISKQHQKNPFKSCECHLSLKNGVSGAKLPLLDDRFRTPFGSETHHFFGTRRGNDYGPAGMEGFGGIQDMAQHRSTGHRMKHLRERRFHPRPLAGGQHYYSQG